MIGFLIKKAFFDLWDNMLRVVLVNLGFVIILTLGFWLPFFLKFHPVTFFGSLFFVLIGFHIYIGAASKFAHEVADYKTPGFRDFFGYFRQVWKAGLVLAAITMAQIVLIIVAFPFYMSMGGFLGTVALSVIFWASVAWQLASQYFFAIHIRLGDGIGKTLKKCFIVMLDNTLFTVFLGIATVLTFALSVITAFLIPGFTGLILLHQVAFKLRLYKYDYLEEHPELSNKKNIPWDRLLEEDREKVGTRNLKGMIFPWKE